MTVSIDLPSAIENLLRKGGQDPAAVLKESALVDLYRRGAITQQQLCDGLGLNRIEVDAVLKRHDVPIDQTVEELRDELDSLHRDRSR
jgi:hypothetical protein